MVLNAVGVAMVRQQLLQMVASPTNITAELLLTSVGPLVNPELRLVEELLATCQAGGAGVSVGQLVGMFVEDVVLQVAVRLPTDGTELSLTTVDSLVAAKVGHTREAPSTSCTLVRSYILMHQLVTCQVTGVVEALPTDVTDKRLLKVSACVAFAADVAVKCVLSSV